MFCQSPRESCCSLRHVTAAQHAGDGAQARPRAVASQPESLQADVVWKRVLIGVLQALAHAADCTAWSACVRLIGAWRPDAIDGRFLAKRRVNAPCILHKAITRRLLLRCIGTRR